MEYSVEDHPHKAPWIKESTDGTVVKYQRNQQPLKNRQLFEPAATPRSLATNSQNRSNVKMFLIMPHVMRLEIVEPWRVDEASVSTQPCHRAGCDPSCQGHFPSQGS